MLFCPLHDEKIVFFETLLMCTSLSAVCCSMSTVQRKCRFLYTSELVDTAVIEYTLTRIMGHKTKEINK